MTRVYSEQSASGVRAWCVASVAVAPPWICGARQTKALLPSKGESRAFGAARAGQGWRLWARAGDWREPVRCRREE